MEEPKIEERKEEPPVAESVEAGRATEELVEPSHEEEQEKRIEELEEGGGKETEEKVEGLPPSESLTETPSFQEESYKVGDLKEGEKKALEAFRLKVEEAIKNKTIFKKPKKKVEEKAATELPTGVETEAPAETPVLEETEPPAKDREIEPTLEAEESAELLVSTGPIDETPADSTEPAEKREILVEGAPVPPIEGPKNFYVWGIPIHDGDDKTDALLIKFLRARNFKVDNALGMLKSTVKWRKEFEADGIVEEEVEGKEEFEKWAFWHGVDKEGHPVCYNKNVFQSRDICEKANFGKFLRWRVQMMEKGINSHLDFSPGGVTSFVQVIDLQNSPGIMKGGQSMKKLVSLLQDNYPELAAKQIVLNMPWWSFPALYRLLKVEPKVVWAGPGKSAETLFKYIAPDQVPVEYGGLGRVNDKDFEGVEAPITQLTVKAGEKQLVEIPIDEAGATLVWDITIVGWDVVYGEEFVPDSYTVLIQKPKKLAPSTEPIRNSYKASEPGKVVLSIDNSASKKKKTIVYRSTVKRTPVE